MIYWSAIFQWPSVVPLRISLGIYSLQIPRRLPNGCLDRQKGTLLPGFTPRISAFRLVYWFSSHTQLQISIPVLGLQTESTVYRPSWYPTSNNSILDTWVKVVLATNWDAPWCTQVMRYLHQIIHAGMPWHRLPQALAHLAHLAPAPMPATLPRMTRPAPWRGTGRCAIGIAPLTPKKCVEIKQLYVYVYIRYVYNCLYLFMFFFLYFFLSFFIYLYFWFIYLVISIIYLCIYVFIFIYIYYRFRYRYFYIYVYIYIYRYRYRSRYGYIFIFIFISIFKCILIYVYIYLDIEI